MKVSSTKYPRVGVHPHPTQTQLPIWVGGHGKASVKLAASVGGLIAWAPPEEELLELRDRLKSLNPSAQLAVSVVADPGERNRAFTSARELLEFGADAVLILVRGEASEILDFLSEPVAL